MPINGVIGISAEREIGCQLFIVTVTEIKPFMGPPPARRARAPVGHPSGPRGACGARVLASALGELDPLLQRIHP